MMADENETQFENSNVLMCALADIWSLTCTIQDSRLPKCCGWPWAIGPCNQTDNGLAPST